MSAALSTLFAADKNVGAYTLKNNMPIVFMVRISYPNFGELYGQVTKL
jgi:hypothetical protein